MRNRLKTASAPALALERVLEGLKQELIDASDAEITAAARELGMRLEMPESAAFAGLSYPARPQLSDFFELEAFRHLRLSDERVSGSQSNVRAQSRRNARRVKRHSSSRASKTRDDS